MDHLDLSSLRARFPALARPAIEYERIRARLGPKLREQLDLPAPPARREKPGGSPGEPPPAAAPDQPEIPPTGV